ncbi:MAG TPA: nucleoside diphosphate kinase regulator [Steroidobacteraceae bacterium]|nr:nucleoside diphosphate kinase regulator [Steroidobacteraceae bacterium]
MELNLHSRAAALPEIIIPASEYDRLLSLAHAAARTSPLVAEYLDRELGRATVLPDESIGCDFARVGSHVTFRDDQTGRTRDVVLVWPHEADVTRDLISVLTSIGAALLGLRPGQSIDWPSPVGGPRTLTVIAVRNEGIPQPPAAA